MKNFISVIVGILGFISIAVVFMVFLSHRVQTPSTVLLETECTQPCWYGIQLGVASSDIVWRTLLENDLVDLRSIREWTYKGEVTQMAWKFHRPVSDSAGYAYFENGQCTAISILTFGSLNLSDAIETLGEPEWVWTHLVTVGNRGWVEVTLLSPHSGHVIEVDVDFSPPTEPNSMELQGKSPVYRVTYFDPSRYYELMQTEILINQSPRDRSNVPQPWNGFGTISTGAR